MSDPELPSCSRQCLKAGQSCQQAECRMWIDFSEDQNCCLISIYNSKGKMTLDDISKRMKVSLVRVSQIEKQALKKLRKRIKI